MKRSHKDIEIRKRLEYAKIQPAPTKQISASNKDAGPLVLLLLFIVIALVITALGSLVRAYVGV